jgi:UDP-N-acetylmuramoyl-tripeptide--D-alanyl-D-alanine ligase
MTPMRLSTLATLVGGRLVGSDATVDAVATDTRAPLSEGRDVLFVAIAGANFDGHAHVASAATAGARAALVSRETGAGLPEVVVDDTVLALGRLAAALQHTRATRVVAITGSNGKTSVKALVLAILEGVLRVHANPGNRNNEIGLPLAVIDAPDDADVAVYEMGAGQPGDIAHLVSIAPPTVSVVNNVAAAHLERMGSLEGVADTKGAIYDALPAGGTAVINADDAFADAFAQRADGRRILRFGLAAGPGVDVGARDIAAGAEGSRFVLVTPLGEAPVALALAGRHNIANALCAAALAIGCGVGLDAIVRGLEHARPVAGRLVRHALPGGAVLVDDSYNANPGSLAAAIDTLAAGDTPGWLVLGDMRELGADAEALHAASGTRARDAGVARVYATGALGGAAAHAFGDGGKAFETHAALVAALRADLAAAAATGGTPPTVLVKGSRGSAMDRVVDALLEHTKPHAA